MLHDVGQHIERIMPGPGQESVWDYPRPPRLERVASRITVELGGDKIVDTTDAFRVLETSHPPVYYVDPAQVVPGVLTPTPRTSWCEFKGGATYWTVSAGGRAEQDAAWSYEDPSRPFRAMKGFVAFYCNRMDRCTVDGETVEAQPGGFYGGWVTSTVVGPFKGVPGSWGW